MILVSSVPKRLVVLFGTNIANEMFEYAKAVNVSATQLKALLLRNVAAIFADDEVKAWVTAQIEKFH